MAATRAGAPRRRPAPLVLFGRALALRYPWCGQFGLFKSYFALHRHCPHCQAVLEREEGYFLGAMLLNFIVAEFVVVGLGVYLVLATWPNVPWGFLQFAAPIGIGLMPVLFFPWSRTLWLALDWSSRPPPTGEARIDHPRPG